MIILLPGLGGDRRMYPGPWSQLPQARCLEWPPDLIPHSISHMAQYFARKISERPKLIVGSSMGGMIGLELAQLVGTQRVALLGSACSGRSVNGFLRALSPLTPIAPFEWLRLVANLLPAVKPQMYARYHPDCIRAQIKSILSWRYKGNAEILRLHGRYDPLIRCHRADHWLNGGHVIAMSHPAECVQVIGDWLATKSKS